MTEPVDTLKRYLKLKTPLTSRTLGSLMVEILSLLRVEDYEIDGVGISGSVKITAKSFRMMLVENEQSLSWKEFNQQESAINNLILYVAKPQDDFKVTGFSLQVINREVELALLERVCQAYSKI